MTNLLEAATNLTTLTVPPRSSGMRSHRERRSDREHDPQRR
jgi:hypothetical protein